MAAVKLLEWMNEVIPARFVIYFMLFMGTTNIYTMRTNVNVAIIAMVKTRSRNATNSTECPYYESVGTNSTVVQDKGEFDWDEESQGIVLSSFFWGYVCTCLLGGILSEKYSAKWIAGIGVLSTAIFTLITPITARAGVWYLVAVRVLEGFAEGVTYSAFYAIIGKWCPPLERSIVNSVLHLGDAVGTAIASPVTAVLIPKSLDNGWPLVFYCFGCLAVVWFVFWTILVFDSPEAHPGITKNEHSFILTSLHGFGGSNEELETKKPSLPWIRTLTSASMWAITAGCAGFTWGYYTQLTLLPTYMKTVLHFDIEKSALYSIIPYLARMVVGLAAGLLVDFAIRTKTLSVGIWRKIAHIISNVIPGALMVAVPFIGCDKYTALAILTLASGIGGVQASASLASFMDYAPNYIGPVYGFVNTWQTVTGILAPYVAGYLTKGNSNVSTWSTVFYIAAGFNFGGTILFVFFYDGKVAKWN